MRNALRILSLKSAMLALLVAFVGGMMLVSCDHKDLVYPVAAKTFKVTISFDWSQVADEDKPEGMRVAIYEKGNDSDPLLYDIPYGTSTTIELPEGEYRVVTYNYDADGVIISTSSGSSGITVTTESTKTPDGEDAQKTPSSVIGSTESDLTQDVTEIDEWGDISIVVKPTRIVYHYVYEVAGVKPLANIAKVSASLSNMYSSMSLSGESATTRSGYQLSTLALDAAIADTLITGEFYTFGFQQSENEEDDKDLPNIFKLYITDKNGDMHELQQDVTAQLKNARASSNYMDKYLFIQFNFEVPKDTTHTSGGGAFDVTADDWEDVNEDIIIN